MHLANMNTPTDPNLSPEQDRWYVTNGVQAVGPVSFDLLTRGVAAGRIPPGSFIRHDAWKVWRRLEEIEALSQSARQEQVELLAQVSATAEERASNPFNEPPPPPSTEELEQPVSGARPLSVRPVAVDPVGVLGSALELEQAFCRLPRPSPPQARTSDFCTKSASISTPPSAPTRTAPTQILLASDSPPAIRCSRPKPAIIVGEPRLGEAGRYIAGRLARCLPGPRGVAMVPLRHNGRLVAMLELGRAARPFRAREIARVEDVIDALEERIVVAGWLD
jgi:hypothetical protein